MHPIFLYINVYIFSRWGRFFYLFYSFYGEMIIRGLSLKRDFVISGGRLKNNAAKPADKVPYRCPLIHP